MQDSAHYPAASKSHAAPNQRYTGTTSSSHTCANACIAIPPAQRNPACAIRRRSKALRRSWLHITPATGAILHILHSISIHRPRRRHLRDCRPLLWCRTIPCRTAAADAGDFCWASSQRCAGTANCYSASCWRDENGCWRAVASC
jgi:hypothetical protein